MAFGPKFSATKLTGILKTALGTNSGGVAKAMLHLGAQKMLKTGASVKDAKALIQKLERGGTLGDKGLAHREFDRQERVANQISRARNDDLKKQRVDDLRQAQANDSVVRQQAHSVSAISDRQGQHSVTAGGGARQAGLAGSTSSSASSVSRASTGPVQLVQTPQIPKDKPVMDIAID